MVVRGELSMESKDLLDSTNLFSPGVQLDGLNLKIFKDIKSKYVIFNQVKSFNQTEEIVYIQLCIFSVHSIVLWNSVQCRLSYPPAEHKCKIFQNC